MAVPTPLFEVFEAARKILRDELTVQVHDFPPAVLVELPYVAMAGEEDEPEEISQGKFGHNFHLTLEVMSSPTEMPGGKRMTTAMELAKDTVAVLDAATWSLTGFTVARCWATNMRRAIIVDEVTGADLHQVLFDYFMWINAS